jgi:NitT/TauT family transport system substrate-binding protein
MFHRKIVFVLLTFMIITVFWAATGCSKQEKGSAGLNLAVEYNTHAACAYVAQSEGWLEERGCEPEAFEVYATGVALAAALTKGSIDAAYICLVPAITAHANAEVPIKIICGTHKYGYALVVNPSKINTVQDLENEMKIGCVKEGGTTDLLLHKIIAYYGLDRQKVLGNVLRMDPAKQIMALVTGQLDAVVVPEHFASIAEQKLGFRMLVKSQDVWPQMQGSVLIVTDKLLQEDPGKVKDLLEITSLATDYINESPSLAAEILAEKLNAFPVDLQELTGDGSHDFAVTPELVASSMANLEYTTRVEQAEIQEVIDFMQQLGYIKEHFSASDILLEQSYFRSE